MPLNSQTKISLSVAAGLNVVLAVTSFGIGAASVYYGNRAEILVLRSRIEEINRVGTDNEQKNQPTLLELQKDIAEVKTDVKWILKRLDSSVKTGFGRNSENESQRVSFD